MPLIVEGERIPTHWAERNPRSAGSSYRAQLKPVQIALINNMPDPALEDTELQFFDLLDSASGDLPVFLKLYALAGVPRTDRGQPHLNQFYLPLDNLWKDGCDAIIMTGTEPRQPDLHQEPYWSEMIEVFEWAERNAASAVLSCLAAHAAVLHRDGIQRHRLSDKLCGIFDSNRVGKHALTFTVEGPVRFPHSRWNELWEDELVDCGYTILTQSADAGVDLFVKQKKDCLFVHFQGHPEYGAETLLKEYRRDIKRFLRQERDTYPITPHGYFGPIAIRLLTEFKDRAVADRREDLIKEFPTSEIAETLQRTWSTSAVEIYSNWLQYVSKTRERAKLASALPGSESMSSRRSAVS